MSMPSYLFAHPPTFNHTRSPNLDDFNKVQDFLKEMRISFNIEISRTAFLKIYYEHILYEENKETDWKVRTTYYFNEFGLAFLQANLIKR